MKKLEKRAILCIIMAVVLFAGTVFFVYRFAKDGDDWATFYANSHIYSEGRLAIGSVYDRNGNLLVENTPDGVHYSDDELTRRATVHAVGDMDGNIGTGALSAFKDKIVGYNLVTGTYSTTGRGNEIKLTIDSDACKEAYQALGGRDGVVGVYNYETGDIVCMVSSPGLDPANPQGEYADGTFVNKLLSSKLIPGSIFKLVTSAAAIETLNELDDWNYTCNGVSYINGEKITCTAAHGTVDFEDALAKSCNCGFADLTQRIGAETMKEYVKKAGLVSSYDVDGIMTEKGSFEFPDDADLNLAWAGIGQYNDELNPLSMMVYMGAIAGRGEAAKPGILKNKVLARGHTGKMIEEETADQLTLMMKNNVVSNYGEYNFPGLDIYAKSGTAEVYGKAPNAWFTGFIKNKGCPYAFIVCVENGGYGSSVAGPVANRVLQTLVGKN